MKTRNLWCYYNPTGIGGTQATGVISGILNPPLTWWNLGPIPGKNWLWPGVPTAQFGPFGGGGVQYSTDAWGLGDAAGVDFVLLTDWEGMRYNCQINDAVNPISNLQTFLGIDGPGPTENSKSADPRRKPSLRKPSFEVIKNAPAKIKLRR